MFHYLRKVVFTTTTLVTLILTSTPFRFKKRENDEPDDLSCVSAAELPESTKYPASITISDINQPKGFEAVGGSAFGNTGSFVTYARINEDDLDDKIISASNALNGRGEVLVLYGSTNSSTVSGSEVFSPNGKNGFKIIGAEDGENIGTEVVVLKNFTKGNVTSLVIGAYKANANTGRVYVIDIYDGIAENGLLFLNESMSNPNITVINGEQAGDYCGYNVGKVGNSLLIGSHGADTFRGKTYLLFAGNNLGKVFNLTSLNTSLGRSFIGAASYAYSSAPVRGLGNISGDDAFAIGARGEDNGAGKLYVIFLHLVINHTSSTKLFLENITNTGMAFAISGDVEDERLGRMVISANINNNIYKDIIVSSYNAYNKTGKVSIFYGGPNISSYNNLSPANLTGPNGFTIFGEVEGGEFGFSIDSLANFKGNNKPGLIIGANKANNNGSAYIVTDPASLTASGVLNISNFIDGIHVIAINGTYNSQTGQCVASGHDYNGLSSVMIGAHGVERAFVLYGDAISNLTSNELTISSGQTITLNSSHLNATYIASSYADSTHNSQINYAVSNVVNGFFSLISNPFTPINNFTQKHISDGGVFFTHDGNGNAPSFKTLIRGTGLATFAPRLANITFINETSTTTTLSSSSTTTITSTTSTTSSTSTTSTTPTTSTSTTLTSTTSGTPTTTTTETPTSTSETPTSMTSATNTESSTTTTTEAITSTTIPPTTASVTGTAPPAPIQISPINHKVSFGDKLLFDIRSNFAYARLDSLSCAVSGVLPSWLNMLSSGNNCKYGGTAGYDNLAINFNVTVFDYFHSLPDIPGQITVYYENLKLGKKIVDQAVLVGDSFSYYVPNNAFLGGANVKYDAAIIENQVEFPLPFDGTSFRNKFIRGKFNSVRDVNFSVCAHDFFAKLCHNFLFKAYNPAPKLVGKVENMQVNAMTNFQFDIGNIFASNSTYPIEKELFMFENGAPFPADWAYYDKFYEKITGNIPKNYFNKTVTMRMSAKNGPDANHTHAYFNISVNPREVMTFNKSITSIFKMTAEISKSFTIGEDSINNKYPPLTLDVRSNGGKILPKWINPSFSSLSFDVAPEVSDVGSHKIELTIMNNIGDKLYHQIEIQVEQTWRQFLLSLIGYLTIVGVVESIIGFRYKLIAAWRFKDARCESPFNDQTCSATFPKDLQMQTYRLRPKSDFIHKSVGMLSYPMPYLHFVCTHIWTHYDGYPRYLFYDTDSGIMNFDESKVCDDIDYEVTVVLTDANGVVRVYFTFDPKALKHMNNQQSHNQSALAVSNDTSNGILVDVSDASPLISNDVMNNNSEKKSDVISFSEIDNFLGNNAASNSTITNELPTAPEPTQLSSTNNTESGRRANRAYSGFGLFTDNQFDDRNDVRNIINNL